MSLPNFFIAGAAKSGTTSLWRYLLQHPEIFMPATVKEPGYFCSLRGIESFSRYTSLFTEAMSEKMIGEASGAYLTSPESPSWIRQMIPGAKIIIMLRNPVDRAYSLYHWMAKEGYEYAGSFERALQLERDCRLGNSEFKTSNPEYYYNYLYLNSGLYSEQIRRWLNTFPRENFHFIIFEEFRKETCACVKDVFNFLGVDDTFEPEIGVHNRGRMPVSVPLQFFLRQKLGRWLRRAHVPKGNWLVSSLMELNNRVGTRTPVKSTTRRVLTEQYAADAYETGLLIGRDLNRWWQIDSHAEYARRS